MAPTPKLTPDQAYQLKTKMWEGAPHKELMTEFDLSYQIVVGTKAGRFYGYVPWPDGSTGALPEYRKQALTLFRQRATVSGKQQLPVGKPSLLRPPSMAELSDLDKAAHKAGFVNIDAMLTHFKQEVENERHAKLMAEHAERMRTHDARSAAGLKRKAKEPARPIVRQDIVDPEANEKLDWGYIIEMAPNTPVVLIAEGEGDEALKMAICICFKLFPSTTWGTSEILKPIYEVKRKIETFWGEQGEE